MKLTTMQIKRHAAQSTDARKRLRDLAHLQKWGAVFVARHRCLLVQRVQSVWSLESQKQLFFDSQDALDSQDSRLFIASDTSPAARPDRFYRATGSRL